MDRLQIVRALESERTNIDNAIAALTSRKPPRSTRRTMSAQAREKISRRMKARWRERKRKAA